jgi:hypothetical protein
LLFADKAKANETDNSESASSEQHEFHEDIGQGLFGDESEEKDHGDSDVMVNCKSLLPPVFRYRRKGIQKIS